MMGYRPFNAMQAISGGINEALSAKAAQLQNKRAQMMNQEMPAMNAAKMALLNAQVKGADLKNQYLPQTMQIMQQNANTKQGMLRQSQNRFGNAYALQKYFQTPFGKKLLASNPQLAQNVANYVGNQSQQLGGVPGQAAPVVTPQQVAAGMNSESQKLLKDTTDAQARQKNLYAANIDKTLAQINPDDLTQYAGIKGVFDKGGDEFLTMLGEAPKDYQKYTNAMTNSKLLAKQVRQFYGDSIQPSVIQALQNLTNPATWKNNPQLAKQQFEAFANTLRKETQTYRSAMQSPGIYMGNPVGSQSSPSQPAPPGRVTVISPNGDVGHIPADQLQAALAQGYKRG